VDRSVHSITDGCTSDWAAFQVRPQVTLAVPQASFGVTPLRYDNIEAGARWGRHHRDVHLIAIGCTNGLYAWETVRNFLAFTPAAND
jgi:hypothetical protein